MASYLDTVLAHAPLEFYRLDDPPFVTAMPDLMGNETGATYFADGTHSIASPIETDPLSRAIAGRVGTVPCPDGGFLETGMAGDFTQSGWILYPLGGLFADTGTIFSRATQWGVTGGMTELAYAYPGGIVQGHFYQVHVVREGTVLSLYVNGYLKARRTDIPTLFSMKRSTLGINDGNFAYAMGSTSSANAPYYLGVSGSANVWYSAGTDEVIFNSNPLSDAEVLAEYEAAIARQPMYATISMRTTVVADLTPPPPIETYQLKHNWSDPIIERIGRTTGVQMANDGTEERTGRATKTRRRFNYSSLVPNALAQREFAAFLRKSIRKPSALPVLTDAVSLTADALIGDTVLYFDNEFRAFDVGSRVMLSSSETLSEVVKILTVDTGSVTITTPLVYDWDKGTRVFPAKLAYLDQEVKPLSLTSTMQAVPVTASVLVEDIPETPNDITPFTPAQTYRSVEVFNPFQWGLNDYGESLENSVNQVSEYRDFETGVFSYDSDIAVAQDGIAYHLLLDGREQISLFRGWFEARAGRLNKLWVPTLLRDFGSVVDMTADFPQASIIVEGHLYNDNYNSATGPDINRRDVCLFQLNRSMLFRRITACTVSGDNDVLDVDTGGLDGSVEAHTRYICFLRMMRLEADELEFAWYTSDKVRVSLMFREVLNEAT